MTTERIVPIGDERTERRRRAFIPPRVERGHYEKAIKDFDVPRDALEALTSEESRVFALLTTAVRRVEGLFALQEGPDDKAKFYPPGATRHEVRRQAETDPRILSPYTFVEEGLSGQFTTRSMVEANQPEIQSKRLTRILKDAANFAGKGRKKDERLRDYLKAKARWLETGLLEDFIASDRIWLEREEEPTIGFVFGLYDSYLDKFLNRKYSWWASVGLLNRPMTEDLQRFLDEYQMSLQQQHGLEPPKQRVRVDHTRLYAGLAARMEWSANSMFPEQELRKIGSLHIVFGPRYFGKFYNEKLPAFKEFVDQNKVQGITDGFILTADLRLYTAHESGHSIPDPEDLETRLQQEKNWVEEAYCELLALTSYRKIHGLSQRESELAMAMSLIDGYMEFIKRPRREDYYRAYSNIAGYLIREGAVRVEEGRFTWDDTQNVFDCLEQMHNEIEEIFKRGKARDAQAFNQANFNPQIYRSLMVGESYSLDQQES